MTKVLHNRLISLPPTGTPEECAELERFPERTGFLQTRTLNTTPTCGRGFSLIRSGDVHAEELAAFKACFEAVKQQPQAIQSGWTVIEWRGTRHEAVGGYIYALRRYARSWLS